MSEENELPREGSCPTSTVIVADGRTCAQGVVYVQAPQALCFMAGAYSIFTGDKLLTAANAGDEKDSAMLAKLGLVPMEAEEPLHTIRAGVHADAH